MMFGAGRIRRSVEHRAGADRWLACARAATHRGVNRYPQSFPFDLLILGQYAISIDATLGGSLAGGF
jgi:hypothetical protein